MTIPADMPESEVVRLLNLGDATLFACVVDRYQRAMLGVASRFATNRAVADEVVQEAWLAVLDGLPRFEGRSSLRTWILTIVANRARTRAGREARTPPISAFGEDDGDTPTVDDGRFNAQGLWAIAPRPWTTDTPEAISASKQALNAVERAIAALPPRQRAVLVLRDVEHVDADEVCRLLDLTEGNQRVVLHRARTAVRDALAAALENP